MDLPGRQHLERLTETARDTLTVRRVFGEAYTEGGVTVIPVASVMGGTGLGYGAGYRDDASPDGEGGGGGFGVRARPLGAYVVRDGSVRWHPAVDVDRLALGAQVLAGVAVLAWASTRRTRR